MIHEQHNEINWLKGERGKPDTKGNVPKAAANHSSEKERHQTREYHKMNKKTNIMIHRDEVAKSDRESLPADAIFNKHEEVIIQDIIFRAENVRFLKEK